ncbi:MAG: DUF1992 domain-containing protein [Vicinamibacterales bacterium]
MFDKVAEKRIREAMSEGKFDHLPKKGRIDLEDYFKTPEDWRMAYSILKSASCVPEEVELLREVERLDAAHATETDPAQKAARARELADARLKLDLAMERLKRDRARRDAGTPDSL